LTGLPPAARASRLLADLAADSRYALRSWVRQPGFVLIAVLSLGCGIGLNTAVFSIINTIFLQGIRGVPAADQVVTIGTRVPFATVLAVRDGVGGLGDVAAWQPIGADLKAGDLVRRGAIPVVSDNYFATLGVVPARGRFFTPSGERVPPASNEVVLDYQFWVKDLGGNPDIIGQSLVINRVPVSIIGVAPESFHGFGPERPPLWMPMGLLPAIRGAAIKWDDPAESGWRIIGRLAGGVAVGQLNAELRTIATRAPEVFTAGPLVASVGPELWSGPVSGEKRIEFLLVVVLPLVVVALILWIGCSNVANLLLSRAAMRRKEIAIRLANGASRSRLIRLLLTESLLLAVAGGVVGLLLAVWTLDFIWLTLPEAPRLAIELDTHVLFYTGAVCVLATMLFGLIPALHATRVDVAPLLKSETPTVSGDVKRGVRMRRFFLITQFASSMALVVVAGTFVRTVITAHLGEQSAAMDHIAIAGLDTSLTAGPARASYWQSVRESLQRLPNVTAVSIVSSQLNQRAALVPEGSAPTASRTQVDVQRVDAGFLTTSGLSLAAGHFDPALASVGATERVAVNERAARQYWGTTDVLDRRFSVGTSATVLSVAAVVRDDNASARVYRALRDDDVVSASVLVRGTSAAEGLVGPVRTALAPLVADSGFVRVTTLREASLGSLTRITRLALVIAGLVLALATVGLYGSIAFVTAQRTREIAIRMAIGAPRAAVLGLVAREGMLVVAAGSLIGLALIGTAFQFMSGMIFARWSLDPLTIAGVLAVFSLATLGASYLPGRRAARLDPMRVLRGD
jgi:putative ABC transport system permease protein